MAKKKKKIKFILILLLLLIAAGGIYYNHDKKMKEQQQEQNTGLQAAENQELLYGKIESIKGNEVTYQVLEVSGSGETPPMTGERPTMPENGEVSRFGERPSVTDNGKAQGEMPQRGLSYKETNEMVTMLIPVGTEVTTKLGATTTFSRLSAGDVIAILMEEDEGEQQIVAIQIIE